MKRLLLIILIAGSGLGLCFSQEQTEEVLTNKKGVPVLPVAGNWAIGIDATPLFQFAGNIFSFYGNEYVPTFGFTAQTPGAIFGKYKVSENTAYRGALLIGVSNKTRNIANPADENKPSKEAHTAIHLGIIAGIEKNRTVFGRMVGIYGAQVGLLKEPYYDDDSEMYGKLTFKDAENSDNDYVETGGNTFGIMAGGFVGIEYFIVPRVALAGEFGLQLKITTQQKRTLKPGVGSNTTLDYGGYGVELAPSQSGNLQLLFYF